MSERLLKHRETNRAAATVAFNFSDLNRQCDEYLEDVRRQAEQILADATEEAERLRAHAHAEGLEQGRAEGRQEMEDRIEARARELTEQRTSERLQTVIPALQKVVAGLSGEREAWLREWETAAIRLSAAIAERILKTEVVLRPERAAEMIGEALQLAAGTPRLTLRVNPHDAQQLSEIGHPILDNLSAAGEARVVPDPQITRGGCIIETAHGTIDALIETQIDRIIEELIET